MDTQQILQGGELAVFRLRELYRRHGYLPYQMSKFEAYDLYVRNKSFLVSEQILTFTDLDGKLMALKPDVTLSILKNTFRGKGLQKVYYHENVYRPDAGGHNFREIMQAGLECIGELDGFAVGEVVMLAARSLETISGQYLLDLSHLGVAAGVDGGNGVAVAGGRAVTAGAVARGVGVTVIWAVAPAGRSSSGPPVREEYRNQPDTPMAATQRSRTM